MRCSIFEAYGAPFDIAPTQTHNLLAPTARVEIEQEDGAVSQPYRRVPRYNGEELADVAISERLVVLRQLRCTEHQHWTWRLHQERWSASAIWHGVSRCELVER